MQWEYKTIEIVPDNYYKPGIDGYCMHRPKPGEVLYSEQEKTLNSLGEAGWEVISYTKNSDMVATIASVVLKRQK